MGELGFAELYLQLALLHDFLGVFQRFGNMGEMGAHFFRAFEPKIKVQHIHPVLIFDFAVGLNAKQNVVNFGVFFFNIVDVIGGNQGDIMFFGYFDESVVGRGLVGEFGMVLDFQIEIAFAKNILVFQRQSLGFFQVSRHGGGWNFSFDASREGDESFGIFFQNFAIDAGF